MKYAVDFMGWIYVEANHPEEAEDIFWQWVEEIGDKTRINYHKTILERPSFIIDCIEKCEEED